MADGRILHRSAGDSAKVAALSDFEYRVWTQYLLSADDCGVMVAEAVKLQADNRALRNRPKAKVQAALETVIGIGLVGTFDHQGQRYVLQLDWQDRQQIRYPRNSTNPIPPDQTLRECTELTRNLFTKKRKGAEDAREPAGAGGRETLTLTLTPTLTPTPSEADDYSFVLESGGFWRLPLGQVAKWERQYRGVAVRDELHKAEAWLEANKPKRKTAAGMPKFLAAWLGRCAPKPEPKVRVNWFDECSSVHDGACENQNEHNLRMDGALAERKRA